MMNCHCSMCRKHHGSAFATFVTAPVAQFKWVSGEVNVATYESSPGGASAVSTEELTETAFGTHISVRFAKQRSARGRQGFDAMAPMIAGMYEVSFAQLGTLLDAELAEDAVPS
jgi:hypothetical protein